MATGHIDPYTGVYLYGADDPRQPMHDVLNLAQSAAHDVALQTRSDIETLEQNQPTALPLPTAATGYTRDAQTRLMTIGGMMFLNLVLSKAGGIAAETVAQLPPGTWPASTLTVQGVASLGGAATPLIITITPTGGIRNWSAAPSNTLLGLSTFWLATA